MYAINTVLRIIRFVANSFVGLVVGFFLGLFASSGQLWAFIHQIMTSL